MKKNIITSLTAFILAVFFFCFNLPIFAVTVGTLVPENHTVHITYNDGGDVLSVFDKIIKSGSFITLKRFTKHEYIIRNNPGYEIEKLIYNGTDVTNNISGGRFLAPEIICDSNLIVEFKKTEIVKPDHYYSIFLTINSDGKPLPNADVEFSNLKEKVKTDKNGKLRINDVPVGKNNITIWVEGKSVAYAEFFIISEHVTDESYEIFTDGSFTFKIDNEKRFIILELELKDNGIIIPINYSPEENIPPSPATGDDLNILLYGVVIIVLLFLLNFILRFKKEESKIYGK